MSDAPPSRSPATLHEQFRRDGYGVARGLATPDLLQALRDEIDAILDPPLGPLEYEAELGYPGAPEALTATGGRTPRRLLLAYSRGAIFRRWACAPEVVREVCALLGSQTPTLVQAHHNCIMTKYPRYGSETAWHQDIRYWSFQRPDLINVWLALGQEQPDNGGLRVAPGSHRMHFAADQFDAARFFRSDLADNRALLETAVPVNLEAGDVLFFHCRLLHAAGRNEADAPKRSLVFTYTRQDNAPLPGTRSARLARIPLPEV